MNFTKAESIAKTNYETYNKLLYQDDYPVWETLPSSVKTAWTQAALAIVEIVIQSVVDKAYEMH